MPDSRTMHASLTKTGSKSVAEFPTTLVGSFITLVRLNKFKRSGNSLFTKLMKLMLISPASTTLGV